MRIDEITVHMGRDKSGEQEGVELIRFIKGMVYAIVGPTGSGKSQLLEDIESLSDGYCQSRRVVDVTPDGVLHGTERSQWIAHLSQSMNFVLDASAETFLNLRCPESVAAQSHVEKVLTLAHSLCGEHFDKSTALTALSGGQSRALMIADIACNSTADVVLMDELENAGIDRLKAMQLLTDASKIVILVTHDPLLALYADYRIVMKNGGVSCVLPQLSGEKLLMSQLSQLDQWLSVQRDLIRYGKTLDKEASQYELHRLLEQCLSA